MTARFLAVSTSGTPDLVVYPDSGKVGACERLPDRDGFWEIFRIADAVDYHEGEGPPAPPPREPVTPAVSATWPRAGV